MKSVESNQKEIAQNRYTVFTLSDHYFALEISYIKEILKFPILTRLPGKNKLFCGSFNLRGKIITVVDIRQLLKLEISENKINEMVVLTEYKGNLLGISVDQVMDLMNIEELKIQLPSRKIPASLAKYVSGFLEKENFGTVYLLDLIKLIGTLNS